MKKSTKKVVSVSKLTDREKFKLKVLNNYANGLTALDAIQKAAKLFDVKVTKSMKAYPHSFIFAYKKYTNLDKVLTNKLNKR